MSGEEDGEGNPAEIPTATSIQTAVDEVATKTESIVYKKQAIRTGKYSDKNRTAAATINLNKIVPADINTKCILQDIQTK